MHAQRGHTFGYWRSGYEIPEVRSVAQAACTPPVPAPAWHGAHARRMPWTHRPRRCKYECYIL